MSIVRPDPVVVVVVCVFAVTPYLLRSMPDFLYTREALDLAVSRIYPVFTVSAAVKRAGTNAG
jgi:hypothetical protein